MGVFTVLLRDGKYSLPRTSKVGAVVVAVVALGLAGCTFRSGKVAYNPKNFAAPDPVELASTTTNYHLGVGDTITIHVFKVDSMSGDQTIDGAGRINLSLLGPIPAAGLTTDQLATALATDLGKRYLNSPDVIVTLKEAVTKTLTVDGSVQSPGIYPTMPKTTLLQVIAMAHGTAEGANRRHVIIFRRINGQRTAAAFDLITIRKGKDPDPPVYPNDVVVVDGSAVGMAFHTFLQAVQIGSVFRPL